MTEKIKAELAELKALAQVLNLRIAELEAQLASLPLTKAIGINERVVVAFEKQSTKNLGPVWKKLTLKGDNQVSEVSATVEEVLPNGDCVLRSRHVFRAGREIHELNLSGVAARASIDAERHVSSDAVRDLKIRSTRH